MENNMPAADKDIIIYKYVRITIYTSCKRARSEVFRNIQYMPLK